MQGEGMNINLNHIIDQVVKDKGIDRAVLVERPVVWVDRAAYIGEAHV